MCLVAQSCPTLYNPMDWSLPGSSVHGNSPGNNTGVGCHAVLLGIFPTQGLNPDLLHCRWILYQLNHQGSLINVDCSQLMSLFDCYQLQLVYLTVEHCPLRNFQHEISQATFDMFDQLQHLLHTLHKSLSLSLFFFAFQFFYPSWKNVAFCLQSWIKMATNFAKFLFRSTPIWQLSQCSLTKLLQMKLKKTKCY